LTAAFVQEFKGAGYNTVQERSMPKDVAKGLALKSAVIKIEEVKSPFIAETKCKVQISFEPWRYGKAMTMLEYEADYTGSGVTDRDELLSKTTWSFASYLLARETPHCIASRQYGVIRLMTRMRLMFSISYLLINDAAAISTTDS
jgi:hypothetical protein